MTIRTRNRLNIALFVISDIILALDVFLLIYNLFTGRFPLDHLPIHNSSTFILTRYDPYLVIFSLYFQIVYVSVTSMILYRSFEKTQASDIVYFYLFLVACLIDSFRLWIPLLDISETYSNLLFFCGNATLFAKIMIPLSLLCTTILGTVEQRQDIEKNIFIIVLTSFFFAVLIPLNTAVTNSNFSVDYGFKLTIKITSIVLIGASVLGLFIDNKNHMRKQYTTIGFGLIAIGINILYYSTNFLILIFAMASLSVGNFLYLKYLHNQYMWND